MPARYAILALLRDRPMHGYELDAEFDKGLRSFCHVSISQIYAFLKSMEEKRWIKGELVMQTSSPPKKVYHLIRLGKIKLHQWLRQAVQERREVRDELLTKIYLCGRLAPEALPALVNEEIRIYQVKLEQLQAQAEQLPEVITEALLDAGRRHAEVDCEWLSRLGERLDQVTPAAGAPARS